MSEDLDLKQIVQSLATGIALVEPGTWKIRFENARFFNWFPPTGDGEADETLIDRVKGLKAETAAARVEAGRTFRFETEATSGGREVPIRVEIAKLPNGEPPRLMVQCTDIAKEREATYMLESYSKMSEKQRRDLEKEKERVEKLLLNLMPRTVYEELKDFGTTTPQRFESATILVLDFVKFTEMAVSHDPSGLVAELNDIFSAFDRIVEMFSCERIRTIGDSYLAVSGLPDPHTEHAKNIAKVALRMRRYLERRNTAHPEQWRARIGINSGPVIGSLVGIQKYVYDLFGPGVNLAARMEGLSEPMRITVSEDTHELIRDEFVFTERGEFDIKGFGKKKLYYLDSELRDRR